MVEKTEKEKEREQAFLEENISLPANVPDEETLQRLFRGKNIAIFNDEIIAQDKSLETLHEKFRRIIPKGESCYIRYIDEGASVYGSCF